MSDSSSFTTLLKVAGPLLFLGLQTSSLFTALSIVRQQSTGALSAAPFGSLFLNCLVWSLYGIMRGDASVLYPNMSGLFVGTFCLVVFHRHAPEQRRPWRMYAALLAIALFCSYLQQRGDSTGVGLVGCALSVAVSGSPLAVLQTVLRDKSTAALPFATSLATWLNNLSWTLYGLLVARDPLIYLPNMLGLVLASAQLALFAVFGFAPAAAATHSTSGKRTPGSSGKDDIVDDTC